MLREDQTEENVSHECLKASKQEIPLSMDVETARIVRDKPST